MSLSVAEACSSVMPIVVPEFVHLDALLFLERRSGECHHQSDVEHCLAPRTVLPKSFSMVYTDSAVVEWFVEMPRRDRR